MVPEQTVLRKPKAVVIAIIAIPKPKLRQVIKITRRMQSHVQDSEISKACRYFLALRVPQSRHYCNIKPLPTQPETGWQIRQDPFQCQYDFDLEQRKFASKNFWKCWVTMLAGTRPHNPRGSGWHTSRQLLIKVQKRGKCSLVGWGRISRKSSAGG